MRRLATLLLLLAIGVGLWLLLGGGEPPTPPPERDGPLPEPAPAPAPDSYPEKEDPPFGPEEAGEEPVPPARVLKEGWMLHPVTVGEGPLLFARRSGWIGGVPPEEHGVWSAGADGEVQPFLHHLKPLRVIGRFDRTHILVSEGNWGRGAMHVLNLEAARHAPFLTGERARFLEVGGGQAIALVNGRLLAISAETPERPRELFGRKVRDVLCTTADRVFVATDSDPVEIWSVPNREGPTLKVAEHPGSVSGWSISWEASPSGRCLAAAATTGWTMKKDPASGEEVFTGGPRIVVLDTATGAARTIAKDIRIGVSMLSSGMPKLEFTWVDERTIRFSETEPTLGPDGFQEGYFRWVDIDVATGKRLAERRYADLGLSHDKPPRDLQGFEGGEFTYLKRTEGRFRRDSSRVFFRGQEEPAAIAADLPGSATRGGVGYVAFSPDGRYAALLQKAESGHLDLTVLDGMTCARTVLPGTGWSWFTWQAATASPR